MTKFGHLLKKNAVVLFFILITALLIGIYRETFFGNKVALSTNYLADFFSPWSTYKFPGWEQGIPHKPIGTDNLRFFYPSLIFYDTEINLGRLPLWDPYIFSGAPHLANFQSATFYPTNVLNLFLPKEWAWTLALLAIPILGTFFSFLYLQCLFLKKPAVIFGAFCFGFSGFILAWMQNALAVANAAIWLPLILFAVEKFIITRKINFLFLLALATCLSILAGYLQITVYIFALVTAFLVFRLRQIPGKERLPALVKVLAGIILGSAMAAIQVIPSAEALFLSPRLAVNIDQVFRTYLLPLTHLVKTLVPDISGNPASYNYTGIGSYNETVLYIGVIPVVFSLFAVVKGRSSTMVRFFVGAFLVSYFLTLNNPITWWILHLPIPLLATFQPSRILILPTFALAVLAAYGLSLWLSNPETTADRLLGRIIVGLAVVLITVGAINIFNLWQYRQYLMVRGEGASFHLTSQPEFTALKNNLLPLALLGILFLTASLKRVRPLALGIIILLAIFGQIYFLNKYLAVGDKQFLYPDHPVITFLQERSANSDRFLAFGAPIPENIATIKQIYSPEGFDPILPYRYGQLLYAVNGEIDGLLRSDIPRIEATLSRLGNGETPADNERRLRLMSLLGVKYVLYYQDPKATSSAKIILSENKFKADFSFGDWQGYEYLDVLPRAFLANNYLYETSPQKTVDLILNPGVDLGKTVITDQKIDFPVLNETGGTAVISSYQPERVVIKTSASSAKILFLSDNYYPGWQAFIDQKETKIYRADFTFRAVVVPAGVHEVVFSYNPESFRWGLAVSVAAVIFFLAGLLYFQWIGPKRRSAS